jgi:hypothetical protein
MNICLDWPPTSILLISAFQAARVSDVRHRSPVSASYLPALLTLSLIPFPWNHTSQWRTHTHASLSLWHICECLAVKHGHCLKYFLFFSRVSGCLVGGFDTVAIGGGGLVV